MDTTCLSPAKTAPTALRRKAGAENAARRPSVVRCGALWSRSPDAEGFPAGKAFMYWSYSPHDAKLRGGRLSCLLLQARRMTALRSALSPRGRQIGDAERSRQSASKQHVCRSCDG